MRRALSVSFALLLAAAAACGDDDTVSTNSSEPGPADGDVPAAVADREWVLVEIVTIGGPQPVADAVVANIAFTSDGQVHIDTGCNSGTGQAAFGDDDIVTVEFEITEIGCVDEDQMAAENAMLMVLGTPMHWTVVDDLLVLTPSTISDSGLRLRDLES